MKGALNEKVLQGFIRVIDAELLEGVDCKALEAEEIKEANASRLLLGGGNVRGGVEPARTKSNTRAGEDGIHPSDERIKHAAVQLGADSITRSSRSSCVHGHDVSGATTRRFHRLRDE